MNRCSLGPRIQSPVQLLPVCGSLLRTWLAKTTRNCPDLSFAYLASWVLNDPGCIEASKESPPLPSVMYIFLDFYSAFFVSAEGGWSQKSLRKGRWKEICSENATQHSRAVPCPDSAVATGDVACLALISALLMFKLCIRRGD